MTHLLRLLVAYASSSTISIALATRLPNSWRNSISTQILEFATTDVDRTDGRARRFIAAAIAISPIAEEAINDHQ
jgi:hypothetical protein